MNGLRVSLFQYEVTHTEVKDRLAGLASVANEQSGRTDILICPELFLPGYENEQMLNSTTSRDQQVWQDRIRDLAMEHGMAILYGCPEMEGELRFNAAICIGTDGQTLAHHRKLHLPNGYEKSLFSTGKKITLFDLRGVRCALLICYDAEFPETVRAAAQAGAEFVIVPTALVRNWVQVAERVMPTRAFENGIYLAYVNFAGSEGGLDYCGCSCLVGPNGLDLARAGSKGALLTGHVDPQEVALAQKKLPYLTDVRRDYVTSDNGM